MATTAPISWCWWNTGTWYCDGWEHKAKQAYVVSKTRIDRWFWNVLGSARRLTWCVYEVLCWCDQWPWKHVSHAWCIWKSQSSSNKRHGVLRRGRINGIPWVKCMAILLIIRGVTGYWNWYDIRTFDGYAAGLFELNQAEYDEVYMNVRPIREVKAFLEGR